MIGNDAKEVLRISVLGSGRMGREVMRAAVAGEGLELAGIWVRRDWWLSGADAKTQEAMSAALVGSDLDAVLEAADVLSTAKAQAGNHVDCWYCTGLAAIPDVFISTLDRIYQRPSAIIASRL